MASVFIDIPGVGTEEAKNAATEATLQAILKAMKGGGLFFLCTSNKIKGCKMTIEKFNSFINNSASI